MIKHCKYRNFWRGNKQGLKWARSHRVGVPTLFDLAGLIAASCLQLQYTKFSYRVSLFNRIVLRGVMQCYKYHSECTKTHHFQIKNQKFSGKGAPSQITRSFS